MKSYRDLEQKIRKIAPKEKYGLKGYLLSENHGLIVGRENRFFIDGPFSFDIGYMCFHAALLVVENADSSRDIIVNKGHDSKKLFSSHFFCNDAYGTIIDPTPIYDFLGENHTIDASDAYANLDELSLTNPLTVEKIGDNNIMVSLSANHYNETVSLELRAYDWISGLELGQNFNIKRDEYKKDTPQGYKGYLEPFISVTHVRSLLDKEIIEENPFSSKQLTTDHEMFPVLHSSIMKNIPCVDAAIHKISYSK